MDTGRANEIFREYGSAVAYIAVEYPNGDQGIGTAFHVGDGIFVTARHVVEGNSILSIGTRDWLFNAEVESDPAGSIDEDSRTKIVPNMRRGPVFLRDTSDRTDIAVFAIEGYGTMPWFALGGHLDDWLDEKDWVLSEAIIFGFPPLPMSKAPTLVAARAEVNAMVDLRDSPYGHFVLSAMPRGGFSGGPAITEHGYLLGMVTRSLTANGNSEELGYMAVLGVEPIWACLADNKMLPPCQSDFWGGFWNSKSAYLYSKGDPNGGAPAWVALFDDGTSLAITVCCHKDKELQERSFKAATEKLSSYALTVTAKSEPDAKHLDFPNISDAARAHAVEAARAALNVLIESGLVVGEGNSGDNLGGDKWW